MGNSSIDDTVAEINKGYRPELLAWLKQRPNRWRELLSLESRINETALSHNEVGLKDALSDYREFFEEMTKTYLFEVAHI